MSFNELIKNACLKLGTNNKAIYPVMAVAAANGIFRPTFTLLKKGENPESKKYAALREGLTEVIAVPTYFACGEIAAKFGKYIASKSMDKRIVDMEKNGRTLTKEVKKNMKDTFIAKGQTGLMLIGVCFAAGVVIPALCSVVVKPIMKKISPKNEPPKLDIKEPGILANPSFTRSKIKMPPVYRNVYSSGMKVGGI